MCAQTHTAVRQQQQALVQCMTAQQQQTRQLLGKARPQIGPPLFRLCRPSRLRHTCSCTSRNTCSRTSRRTCRRTRARERKQRYTHTGQKASGTSHDVPEPFSVDELIFLQWPRLVGPLQVEWAMRSRTLCPLPTLPLQLFWRTRGGDL